jgi:hypothetical protein
MDISVQRTTPYNTPYLTLCLLLPPAYSYEPGLIRSISLQPIYMSKNPVTSDLVLDSQSN